jgi:hypothetical protein
VNKHTTITLAALLLALLPKLQAADSTTVQCKQYFRPDFE